MMIKLAAKKILISIGLIFMSHTILAEDNSSKNAYDFSFIDIKGQPLPLEKFKGKVLMVVNTASKCGFTKQFDGLEKLYQKYKDQGFVILGVPSNDFGNQEPSDEKEIANFCLVNFGVTFPLTKKTVVSGENAHPFYRWAHEQMGFGSAPKWNFHKYIIDKNGKVANYFFSTTKPDSKKITGLIEELLN